MKRAADEKRLNFSIGTVEKLTGLTGRQIRYYEEKGLIHPGRTQGQQRVYAQFHVERLLRIKEMLDEGYTLQQVVTRLAPTAATPEQAGVEALPASEWLTGTGALRSLYPVTDHARLTHLLEERAAQETGAEAGAEPRTTGGVDSSQTAAKRPSRTRKTTKKGR